MWYGNNGLDGWGWIWMAAMMAIVWAPLLFALIWAMRAFTQPSQQTTQPREDRDRGPDARDLARLAYARGELDRERYLQIVDDLEQAARPAPGR
jgi:uncharacterized membrane protein